MSGYVSWSLAARYTQQSAAVCSCRGSMSARASMRSNMRTASATVSVSNENSTATCSVRRAACSDHVCWAAGVTYAPPVITYGDRRTSKSHSTTCRRQPGRDAPCSRAKGQSPTTLKRASSRSAARSSDSTATASVAIRCVGDTAAPTERAGTISQVSKAQQQRQVQP